MSKYNLGDWESNDFPSFDQGWLYHIIHNPPSICDVARILEIFRLEKIGQKWWSLKLVIDLEMKYSSEDGSSAHSAPDTIQNSWK